MKRHLSCMLSILLMLTFLTACASPSISSPTEPEANATQAPQSTATQLATEPTVTAEDSGMPGAGAGLCANAFYPVREGSTWTYKSTGGPAGEYSFTDTITAVRDDGFTLSTQIGDVTRMQEWSCTPEGLIALQLGGAPAAMLNAQDIQLELDVKNPSGVTFPSEVQPGDQWQQNLDAEGTLRVSNQEGKASGTAKMSFQAVENESVTVPAGTFDALKIQVDTSVNVNVTYEGLSLPVTFTGAHTYWFAPGVGWVKATGTGNMLGTSFSETADLQSYSIP